MRVVVGCAGWALSKTVAPEFPSEGTHLCRYGSRLDAVEINSSFYRPHRRETYLKWADCVPAGFRFAVKVPKEITHARRLRDAEEPLARFLHETSGLREKLGVLLVQLPPSLALDPTGLAFLQGLRGRFGGGIALEPRHATWFVPQVEKRLEELRIARVAADPAPVPAASQPGGWRELVYYRMHGSPRMYYSDYPPETLDRLADTLRGVDAERWCIFDNTAEGHAIANALALRARLGLAAPGAVRPASEAQGELW